MQLGHGQAVLKEERPRKLRPPPSSRWTPAQQLGQTLTSYVQVVDEARGASAHAANLTRQPSQQPELELPHQAAASRTGIGRSIGTVCEVPPSELPVERISKRIKVPPLELLKPSP
jgi:hypothetical protein